MADNRTMAQLLEAPTEGYEDAIVVPEITANNFEIKHGLLNLVQNKHFLDTKKEDHMSHLKFNKITSTMSFERPEYVEASQRCQSQSKAMVSKVIRALPPQQFSSDIALSCEGMVRALILDKKNQTPAPAPVKAVEQSCVTCGGGHSYQNCPATDGNIYRDNIQNRGHKPRISNYNQGMPGTALKMASGISNKSRKPSRNDKTEHGMERD
ncbi:hypothetical protein Tco_0908098 [Tanacetum coccineum]|uniref:Reverse transcriptase domain-containing protein n=1 Tax=Tanacetum coccineum TaxID=301880 RepID=A0ABQ5CPF3_9ASTR